MNDYRNIVVAEAMKVLGFVNRHSRGVLRVQKELVANEKPSKKPSQKGTKKGTRKGTKIKVPVFKNNQASCKRPERTRLHKFRAFQSKRRLAVAEIKTINQK